MDEQQNWKKFSRRCISESDISGISHSYNISHLAYKQQKCQQKSDKMADSYIPIKSRINSVFIDLANWKGATHR